MAVGDIYQYTVVQELEGQQVLNVYHYICRAVGTATNIPIALETVFNTIMIGAIKPIQTTDLKYRGAIIINLDNPDEFISGSLTATGDVAPDTMPPFVTWAFRLNRASRSVRNGQKRIGGVPEQFVTLGVATPLALTYLEVLAPLFSAILVEPTTGATFEPRILHRATAEGPGGTPPATPRADYAVASSQYVSVSSQNSRKFGHGA